MRSQTRRKRTSVSRWSFSLGHSWLLNVANSLYLMYTGPANGNKDTTSPFTLEEEGALVAIHNNVVEKASQSPYGKPDYDWDKIEVAMAEMAAETGKGSPRSKEVLQREMARLVGRKVELGRAQERLKQVEKKAEDKDLMKKLGI